MEVFLATLLILATGVSIGIATTPWIGAMSGIMMGIVLSFFALWSM